MLKKGLADRKEFLEAAVEEDHKNCGKIADCVRR